MVRIVLFVCALGALISAISIPFVLATLQRRTGLTFGGTGASRVIASDVGIGAAFVLRDDELGLCGKPDYLLSSGTSFGDRLVPLEVKPTRRSTRLYDSDRIQIGAYLLALKATADDRASKIGYVRYQTRTFEVELTWGLAQEIRSLVATLRRARLASVVHRDHHSPARCRACPVRQHCNEALP